MDDIKPPARFKPMKPQANSEEPLLEAPQEPLLEASHEPLLEATNPTEPPKKPKSSRKHRLLIIILCAVAVIIAAIAAVLFYPHKAVVTDASVKTIAPTTASEIEAASDTMTTAATNETKLTESDDSYLAGDASADANNVGSSINENSF